MNKILVALLLLVGLASPAFAQFDREHHATDAGYVNVASSSVDAILVGRPILIYGATILTSSTNASVNIYDNATASQGTVKVELSSPTSFTSLHYTFNPPINMTNGAYVDVTSASAVIEYR